MKKIVGILLLSVVIFSTVGAQVKAIPFTGTNVTVVVSGSLYGEEATPALNDPLAGVVIWFVSNKEDGSATEARILRGTTYYKTDPDTITFVANAAFGTDTVWAFAIHNSPTPLKGKYTIKVNNRTDSVTVSNVLYFQKPGIFTSIRSLDNPTLPGNFILKQNYPNPFNPTTTIQYEIPARANVQVSIYDVTGRLLRAISPGEQAAGVHSVNWDGKNESGVVVSSGSYFYQVKAGESFQTRKAMMIK